MQFICQRNRARFLLAVIIAVGTLLPSVARVWSQSTRDSSPGIWIGKAELKWLPAHGPAWERLRKAASQPAPPPRLRDQNERTNVIVLAKALVYARTGDPAYRSEVIDLCMRAIGSEAGGRTLSLARKLAAYVIAADLVGLPPEQDAAFRTWLRRILTLELDGLTLQSAHERRPNNWGTHAGASRAAAAAYLGDRAELKRIAQVFRGWLGDRSAYAGFRYGDLSWQCDPSRPVGINPRGCSKHGRSIDGVLPDDQRRSGPFRWPPPRENYVYEALQGAVVQAEILHRAGYDSYDWSDKALLRAYRWLHGTAAYAAEGDDTALLPIIDLRYATEFSLPPIRPAKNIAWTDWTHVR